MKRIHRGDRRVMIGALVAVTVVSLIVLVPTLFQADTTLLPTAFALKTAAEGPVPEDRLAEIEVMHLKPGQHVADALLQARLEPGQIGSALSSMGDLVDLRRVRPVDTFLVYRSLQGDLVRVEYEQRLADSRVIVERDGEHYAAWSEQKPVRRYLRRLEGVVDDNLFFAMQRAGGNAALVMTFSDLFAWDFDFFTETRPGDRFELLVEERTVDGTSEGFGRIHAAVYHPAGASTPLDAYFYAWGDNEGHYNHQGRSIKKFFLKSPLNYRRISSYFSHRRFHPILKKYRPHLGIDYAAPVGTPVVALGNGRVASATRRKGYGRTVQIKHNKEYVTQYAHLSRYGRGIKTGVRVKQGQVIGYVGSSGLSTGPHLDFRVMKNGKWMNPLHLDGGQSEPLPEKYREDFATNTARLNELLQRLSPGQRVLLEGEERQVPALALARLDTPSAS